MYIELELKVIYYQLKIGHRSILTYRRHRKEVMKKMWRHNFSNTVNNSYVLLITWCTFKWIMSL